MLPVLLSAKAYSQSKSRRFPLFHNLYKRGTTPMTIETIKKSWKRASGAQKDPADVEFLKKSNSRASSKLHMLEKQNTGTIEKQSTKKGASLKENGSSQTGVYI
ncbi:hypothetical protein SDJN02_13895, partial [Cucurbita argyrosperma subsp. argyrosperma]